VLYYGQLTIARASRLEAAMRPNNRRHYLSINLNRFYEKILQHIKVRFLFAYSTQSLSYLIAFCNSLAFFSSASTCSLSWLKSSCRACCWVKKTKSNPLHRLGNKALTISRKRLFSKLRSTAFLETFRLTTKPILERSKSFFTNFKTSPKANTALPCW